MRGVWNWIVTRTADYGLPKQIELIDIVQILLIAFFVYHLIRWLQNTKAYTLMKGIFLIGVFVIIANVLKMQTILWLFGNIGGAAITAVVIIFQPELRRVVEQIGEKNPLSAISFASGQEENERFSDKTINELVRASFEMGEVKTGALIVIEKTITLEEYEKTGIPIDGVLTSQLLINIFEHNTPLHDGAVPRVKAHLSRYERLIGSGTPVNDIIEIRGLKIDKTARRVYVNGEEKNFTTKEFDLLAFLAQNPNHVFTKEELFSKIWDMESIGDIATVTVHIKKIREKIEMNTAKPQYIETIWGVGYRFKV